MIHVHKPAELSANELYNLLKEYDDQFYPLLSLRLDLEKYSKKLSQNSTIIFFRKKEKIIGFIAFYDNNRTLGYAFISLICVLKEYQGKGIGERLMNKCISYVKNKNFKSIKLEVDNKNINGLSFYSKLGFNVEEIKQQSLILKRKL